MGLTRKDPWHEASGPSKYSRHVIKQLRVLPGRELGAGA